LMKICVNQHRSRTDVGAFANLNGLGRTENAPADARIRFQNKFGVRTQGPEHTGLETTEGIGPERTVDFHVVPDLKLGAFGDTDERPSDKDDAPANPDALQPGFERPKPR